MRRFQQKLIIPAASRLLIERAELIERLEQAIGAMRVVALAAPAGWGKTTALSQWAAQSALPTAWYALDPADSDPSLFLDYLLHSVAAYVPNARDLITRLASASASELPQLYHSAALAVASASEPFVLVLDDFHLLSETSSATGLGLIQSLLSSIAEYAPNCHLVVASRTPPALFGMIRLISQQRAAVFDYTALQFSTVEVQRLAGISAGVLLSDVGATRLTDQLGGWVTGIVLSLDQVAIQRTSSNPMAVALGAGPSEQLLIEANTTQVYAFLAEQVIAPLPAAVRTFLEDTSVLDYLSPRRCDSLREASDSGALLDEVRQYGLFTISRAGWLSYHSLLRDFLRARLARDPARERRLLRRAGQLYAAEDEIEFAVDCYIAARADEEALSLLRSVILRFRRISRQSTLLACFDRIAAAQRGLLPADLLIAQARVYADLALWERAYLAIRLAETLGVGEIVWEAQLVHAGLLRIQGDQRAAREQLSAVPFAQLPIQLQMMYHMHDGQINLRGGATGEAISALEQAHRLAPSTDLSNDPGILADIYDNLGVAYAMKGERSMALRSLQRADACWQTIGNSGRRAMTLNNIGMIQMEEGLNIDANEAFETGLVLARTTGRRREEALLLCSAADLDLTQGRLELVLSRFAEAHQLAERADLQDLVEYAATGVRWAAAITGDTATAERWLVAETLEQPLPRARAALASVIIGFSTVGFDLMLIDQLLDSVESSCQLLGPVELAYLWLARAACAYQRSGWPAATEAWKHFEESATLPEPLLAHFVLLHDALFTAASPKSPLAKQLRRAAGRTGPSRWQIQALGGFSCRVDGQPCDLSPLHRALLTRLLDAGSQGLAVDRLWESVWGETDLSMTALHQALRRLRVQTGLSTAVRDGSCGIWSDWAEISYDVRQLEQTIEEPLGREMVERALALYRGEFLPGAPDGALYWVETRRAHLQERLLNTLEHYGAMVEAEHPQAAIQLYQRILQIDGCREQTAVRLMQLAARFGNRSLVTATFEHLLGALRVLGASPGATTAAIYRQLH